MKSLYILLLLPILLLGSCRNNNAEKFIWETSPTKFWNSNKIVIDSLLKIYRTCRLFYADSITTDTFHRIENKYSFFADNFSKIDSISSIITTIPDTCCYSFYYFDQLPDAPDIQNEIIFEKRILPAIDYIPYLAIRIISLKNDQLVSTFLLSERQKTNGQIKICSSYLFGDTIILRKTRVEWVSDTDDNPYAEKKPSVLESTELFSFDKREGVPMLIKVIQ
ncbi:MAG TPA: hypothetical protein PKN44_15585 [Bacteroidales bacterium]|nr:hypothetical protein [Bacteroidales bacterium]